MLETIGLITVLIYIMGVVSAWAQYADERNASGETKDPWRFLELIFTWPWHVSNR